MLGTEVAVHVVHEAPAADGKEAVPDSPSAEDTIDIAERSAESLEYIADGNVAGNPAPDPSRPAALTDTGGTEGTGH